MRYEANSSSSVNETRSLKTSVLPMLITTRRAAMQDEVAMAVKGVVVYTCFAVSIAESGVAIPVSGVARFPCCRDMSYDSSKTHSQKIISEMYVPKYRRGSTLSNTEDLGLWRRTIFWKRQLDLRQPRRIGGRPQVRAR